MVNSIVRPGSKRTNIKEVLYKNKLHSTNDSIAIAFNNFFVNVVRKLSEPFNSQLNINDPLQFLNHNGNPNSFFFAPIIDFDIHNLILSLKNKSGDIESFNVKI